MEETISLKELFSTIKKRFALITIVTLVAVMISAIVSYFILTPTYESSSQILVNQTNNNQGNNNYNEIQANIQLINTYNVIIKSRAILNIVKEELDLPMSTTALDESITVSSAQNSQVVNITVSNEDANLAASIANKTAQVFQREISTLMNGSNTVSILAEASVSENQAPVSPRPTLNIAIAFVVGLMAGVGIAFLLEYLDNTIKNETDVEKLLQLPVLGVITTIDEVKDLPQRAEHSVRSRGETVGL
ncbi:capsular biosynthesis protein [Bacillaceae bacterium Marseille-Q3522]|nr:capsular biosynthesis protein [Bacillaceae bacterium Marseille-Q3522]